jgi:hypothetical protein
LGADGYWNQYFLLGPNANYTKLKTAVDLPPNYWQTAQGRVYATGGLPSDWKHVFIRSRSKTLFGWYRFHSAIAFHSYCEVAYQSYGVSKYFVDYTQRIT